IPLLGGSCWWFVGPFQNPVGEGFDRAYPVEDKPGLEEDYLGRTGALIKWQKTAFKETVMPLESIFTGVQGVAYGVTTLHVPTPTDAKIAVLIGATSSDLISALSRQLIAASSGGGGGGMGGAS